jgi:outer membrane protein assembly factor BamB
MLRLAVCILLSVQFQSCFYADEPRGYWPQWRGPNRDNASLDSALLTEWPADGPPLRWSVQGVGEGIAAVAVADGRVVLLGDYDGEEYVTSLDERTGRRLWAVPIGQAAGQSPLMRWLSQRTPTLDHDRLYAITAHGELVCLAAQDGAERWRRNYQQDFGSQRRVWGFCDYPLVDGDRLICCPLGRQLGIVALNKFTGQAIWHSPVDVKTRSMYGAAIPLEVGGAHQVVAALNNGIGGWSASDGSRHWWYPDPKSSFTSTHTPLRMVDGSLVCPLSYGKGIVRLKLSRKARDSWEVDVMYLHDTVVDPFQDGTVCVGENVYARCYRPRALTSFKWQTGETVWTQENLGAKVTRARSGQQVRGSVRPRSLHAGRTGITWADGHLYCLSSDGALRLIEDDPVSYVERSVFLIPEYQPALGVTLPVVTGGSLYIRDNDRLLCFDVGRDAEQTSQSPAPIILAKPESPRRASARLTPRPIFVPTPDAIVDKMLDVSGVAPGDVLVDLGSGDGRIVLSAAKRFGCRAIGYEIDTELVMQARDSLERQHLGELVTIRHQDMFTANLSNVDVVAIYLYPVVLEKLKPQFARMKPGSRIVSHFFEIPGWKPSKRFFIASETGDKHEILLYELPVE